MVSVDSLIVSIVQGITEWFPISSTTHILLTERLLNVQFSSIISAIHLGSLIALVFLFRKDLWSMAKAVRKTEWQNPSFNLLFLVVLASISTLPLALVFKRIETPFFYSPEGLAAGLGITALFLFLAHYKDGKKTIHWTHALIIGLVQGLTIIPSISRLGFVFATALLLGINRKDALKFSFLLDIPAIAGTVVLDPSIVLSSTPFLGEIAITAAVGILTFPIAQKILQKRSLLVFSLYCLTLGLILLV